MARTAAAAFWSQIRVRVQDAWRCPGLICSGLICAGVILLALTLPAAAQSDPVKAEATFGAADGYARLVLKFAQDVTTEVTSAGSIAVIRFERPVDIAVESLAAAVPDYVSMVRRDPDGTAIRLSLSRKVAINTMMAGERVFIDFLPETWSGPPPSLPLEIVRELALDLDILFVALGAQALVALRTVFGLEGRRVESEIVFGRCFAHRPAL